VPITDASPKGIIRQEDLALDDLVSVDIAVDHSSLGVGSYLQIVRMEVDGKRVETFLTLLLNKY
jgi:hypothetical protein